MKGSGITNIIEIHVEGQINFYSLQFLFLVIEISESQPKVLTVICNLHNLNMLLTISCTISFVKSSDEDFWKSMDHLVTMRCIFWKDVLQINFFKCYFFSGVTTSNGR